MPSGHGQASSPDKGILLVVPWDQSFGGVNTVVRSLAQYLTEIGYQPTFLFPGNSVFPTTGVSQLGFPSVCMNLRPMAVRRRPLRSRCAFVLTLPLALWSLVRLVQKHGIRVVNVHYPDDNALYFAALRRLTGVRLVTSVHGSDITGLTDDATRRHSVAHLLRQSDVIVAPSKSFANFVRDVFPTSDRNLLAIWNGIDVQRFASMAAHSDDANMNEALRGITDDRPYIICVAAFNEKKAHDTLLRAFVNVIGNHRLILVGDGILRPDIERLARDLGISDRVVIAGEQPPSSVARLLAGAACSVMPSRSEPFGIAAVESMVVGTPVVTSGVGGLGEIITNERTGLHFPVDDANALAEALNRILKDQALRARLANAGQAHARANFDWRSMAARYVELAYALPTSQA